MNKYVLAILLLFSCMFLVRAQPEPRCLEPLANPNSNNPADWSDIVNFAAIAREEGVTRVLTITSGRGDKINLDFYSVTFRKHPTKDLATVFREIRQQFPSLAHREANIHEDEMDSFFRPYRSSSALNDPVKARNKTLWESNNPKGAVMSFILASHTPALALKSTLRGLHIALEQGDVACTCATATDFVFSTVHTVNGGYHPVSGNRVFGIMDNENGTWTFYSKGADRETRVVPVKFVDHYFGNFQLKRGARSPMISGSILSPNEDAVFEAGHLFWLEFFPNLQEYLNREGMTPTPAFIKNSKRYPYSPPHGPSPNPTPGPTPGPSPRP